MMFKFTNFLLSQSNQLPSASKDDVYTKTIDAIELEIQKLVAFMDYKNTAILKMTSLVAHASQFERDNHFRISDSFIGALIRFVDLLALLDALKNMKASLNNDFSYYKRIWVWPKRRAINRPNNKKNWDCFWLVNIVLQMS